MPHRTSAQDRTRPAGRAKHRLARLTVLFVLACGTLPAAALRTIHVPRDFPTIQQAVEEASDGDTVLVAPGTYRGQINFSEKDITLISVEGAASTTLTNEHRAVNMGPRGRLAGFTITCPRGGAVNVRGEGSIIEDCIFEGNGLESSSGSACLGGLASPIIRRNIFRNNGERYDRGSEVLGFANSSSPRIENNLFHDNDALCMDLELPRDTRAVVVNNTIVNCGGGIAGGAYVANNIIVHCKLACRRHSNMPRNWVFENNLLYGNDEDYNLNPRANPGAELNTLRAAPRFVDADRHDYRLLPSSPAIDTGAFARAPVEDMRRGVRPAPLSIGEQPRFDIGAYEYIPEGYDPAEAITAPGRGYFVLIQARWGRGSDFVDVSAPVLAHMVEQGLDVHADTGRVKADPTPNRPKTLVLHYRIGTREYYRVFTEGERALIRFVNPPLDAPPDENIVILEAAYGASNLVVDRTDWLAEVVATGQTTLAVGPEAIFIDPAPARRKVLTVAYLYQGRYCTAAVADGQTLDLAPDAAGPATATPLDPAPRQPQRYPGVDHTDPSPRPRNPPPFPNANTHAAQDTAVDTPPPGPSGLTIQRQAPYAAPAVAAESAPLVPASAVRTTLWVVAGIVALVIALVVGLLLVVLVLDKSSKRRETPDGA